MVERTRNAEAESGRLDSASGAELADFVVGKDTRPDEEAETFWAVKGEHTAATWHDVDCELRVLPILELAFAHVEGFTIDFAELNVGVADDEFAPWKAHGRASVATSTGLVEHERPMFFAEHANEMDGKVGGEDLLGKFGHSFRSLPGWTPSVICLAFRPKNVF